MLKDGMKVVIRSAFGGIFDGKTGIVKKSKFLNDFVLVELDEPTLFSGRKINDQLFYPSEIFVLAQ